jgi:hypothetical protein
MDYGKVLVDELAREGDSYRPYEENDGDAVFGDHEYLHAHVPDEGDVVKAFQELAYANGERSVMLVPIRPYLQTKLMVTPERLDELISCNRWLMEWIGHIRASQEVKIMELFGAGNIDDGKMKWLLWAVLGESVDISSGRVSSAMGTESILRELNG